MCAYRKPFRVLAMLLAQPGRVVTREELQQELWPEDQYGEFDLGLNTAVKKLRQAFGDSATSPKWIETVPKVGYRFLSEAPPASPDAESPEPDIRPRSLGLIGAVAATAIVALGAFGRPDRLLADRAGLKLTVVLCATGNQFGYAWNADASYRELIRNFSPREVSFMLEAASEYDPLSIRLKHHSKCKSRFRQLVQLVDRESVPIADRPAYDRWCPGLGD